MLGGLSSSSSLCVQLLAQEASILLVLGGREHYRHSCIVFLTRTCARVGLGKSLGPASSSAAAPPDTTGDTKEQRPMYNTWVSAKESQHDREESSFRHSAAPRPGERRGGHWDWNL